MRAEVVFWPWWVLGPVLLLMLIRYGRRGPSGRGPTWPRDVQLGEREDPRVAELEARVAELENRLDFAERLLSSSKTADLEQSR